MSIFCTFSEHFLYSLTVSLLPLVVHMTIQIFGSQNKVASLALN